MRKSLKDPLKEMLPSPHDWRTSDSDEINKRRYRARTESLRVRNLDSRFPIFSNFEVRSGSGLIYQVEIRNLSQRRFSCECVDFRINGLGTCKHVEATLLHLEARHRKLKMAQLLGNGDLTEEEREALLQSALWMSRALAVEARRPEPQRLEEISHAPASLLWGEASEIVRDYASNPSAPATSLAAALEQMLLVSPTA